MRLFCPRALFSGIVFLQEDKEAAKRKREAEEEELKRQQVDVPFEAHPSCGLSFVFDRFSALKIDVK